MGVKVVVDSRDSVVEVEELSSVAAELDSVDSCGDCSVEEGFSASGLVLDPSDSVASGFTLTSVVSGTEVELEVPSVGLLVT